MKFFSTLLSALLFSPTAFAGGTIPENFGMDSPRFVPATSSQIRWDVYGSVDASMYDTLGVAVASVDAETLKFRLLYGKFSEVGGGSQPLLRFRGVNPGVSPTCTDGVPGGCELAETWCLASSVTTIPNTRTCIAWRTDLYVGNIIWSAANSYRSIHTHLHDIARHEVLHVLGFRHGSGGPMTAGNLPISACQQSVLDDFVVDPAVSTWQVVSSCLAP